MYSKLMWCGVSLLLNKLKPDYISNAKSLELEVIHSEAKNNKYNYTFKLNGRMFNCEYVFANNVCVYGITTITDIETTTKTTFTTEHLADATKCSTSIHEFNEFYTCYNKCFIDITVANGLVTDIATLEVCKVEGVNNTQRFILKHISIGAPVSCELSPILIKTLFAATAAMDYTATKCHDPVIIGKGDVNIILFDHSDRRIICLTKPCENNKGANIVQLINSEFKQIIQYNTTHKDESQIEEYVLGENNDAVLRRAYICKCSEDLLEVTIDGKHKFSVELISKNIFFVKK